jgi:hypothetical protein
MADKQSVSSNRKRIVRRRKEIDTISIEQEVKSEYPSGVLLRLRLGKNVRYITIGKETGQKYTFHGINPLMVDASDVPELLDRKQKRSCCAGTPGQAIFEEVN